MIVEIHVADLTPAAMPPEHQPPLLVHPDRMPVAESALQLLEMIARRHAKVGIGGGVIQHLEPSEQSCVQIRRNPLGPDIPDKEVAQPSIPERDDHASGPFVVLTQCTTRRYTTPPRNGPANDAAPHSRLTLCYPLASMLPRLACGESSRGSQCKARRNVTALPARLR